MRSLLEDEPRPSEIDLPPDGISLDLLRAVYRNPCIPLATRIRAAGLAIPYETPKLAVTGIVEADGDIAAILDRRIKRLQESSSLNTSPKR
jgi:hypothetical protein